MNQTRQGPASFESTRVDRSNISENKMGYKKQKLAAPFTSMRCAFYTSTRPLPRRHRGTHDGRRRGTRISHRKTDEQTNKWKVHASSGYASGLRACCGHTAKLPCSPSSYSISSGHLLTRNISAIMSPDVSDYTAVL